MKFLALYLPQYHQIPENNRWWGEGYTEWSAVQSAKPLFKGHVQPKVPLGNNYYDLSDPSGRTWKEQTELAKEYGIDGFCIYHYWFKTGKQLLEKPAGILLEHKEIEFPYCFCWANESWTKTWYGLTEEVLMKQEYLDEKEWENHYQYLRRFFLDRRYIQVDHKPMLCIYRSDEIERFPEMIRLWTKLAQKDGFTGLYVVSCTARVIDTAHEDFIDAYYNFEPGTTLFQKLTPLEHLRWRARRKIVHKINPYLKTKRIEGLVDGRTVFRAMLRPNKTTHKTYPGIYTSWDNTPRRSYQGVCHKNISPALFGGSLQRIITKWPEDFLFINAWNEWGEGAYLEPDEQNKYAYLEQIKKAKEILNGR